MAKFQTTIQKEDALRLGSVKFEVAPYAETPTFVDLGAMNGTKLAEKFEIETIAPDNAPPIKRVKNHTVIVSGEWQEPTLEKIAALRGSFDTLAQVAGTDTLKTGGNTSLGYVILRLTNTNAATKTYQVTVYKAQITKGLEQAFNADAEMKPATIPLEFEGILDLTLTAGAQLFEIADMQAPKTPAA